ncbi:hypothetical protein FB005_1641 [Sinorhizobium medicae]|nr:hypothetical protein FB006_1679 [Sinorhizobium medicae]TWA32406.1 hypothetical protein FB005_1641 [Sinorhizobium medicae]
MGLEASHSLAMGLAYILLILLSLQASLPLLFGFKLRSSLLSFPRPSFNNGFLRVDLVNDWRRLESLAFNCERYEQPTLPLLIETAR